MHSHSMGDAQIPMWKQLLSSVPIVGAFVNPINHNNYEVADNILKDIASLSGQTASMYLLPLSFKDHFPHVSEDMELQMNVQMGTTMALRMWIGDTAARMTYAILSRPVKNAMNQHNQSRFTGNLEHTLANELAQLIPLIGSYFNHETILQAVKNGTMANLDYLAMLTGGTIAMMLSPAGMESDPESVAISTSMMILGMSATMMADTLLRIGYHNTKSCLLSLSLFKRSHEMHDEEKALLPSVQPSGM